MLSTIDLDHLIAVKKREIEEEKISLGLSSAAANNNYEENNIGPSGTCESKKQVNFTKSNGDDVTANGNKKEKELHHLEECIPADLDRYIRACRVLEITMNNCRLFSGFCDALSNARDRDRYLGLPVMLKAGEYSPNNPLIRAERSTGDVLVGLGEYERRRNTLRKIRQQQYREYLDQQAKKKQEAKEQAEREQRENERREREREERERLRIEQELERRSPVRRVSVNAGSSPTAVSSTKVDTAIQVDRTTRPLSVAVQTDDAELFGLPSPKQCELTEAERELSPRTVVEGGLSLGQFPLKDPSQEPNRWKGNQCNRRRSYGDFDERTSTINKSNRDKLVSDLRHTYMPSIFDADAIQMRNMLAEKEAAERRQFYQQELKNQIMEQQRIKEERKTREKMLEQAEMRRLEEQLKMLKVAQDKEITKQRDINVAIKEHAENYEKKRIELQNDIDIEVYNLRDKSLATRPTKRITTTSKSDTAVTKLPFFYPKLNEKCDSYAKTYTTDISDNSVFSTNYDVDSYLRRNLNFNNKNLGRSTSVDDFKIANDKRDFVRSVYVNEKSNKDSNRNGPAFKSQFEDKSNSAEFNRLKTDSPVRNKIHAYTPRKIQASESPKRLEEYFDNYKDVGKNINVKSDRNLKSIEVQFDLKVDNKQFYDYEIDDIIEGLNKGSPKSNIKDKRHLIPYYDTDVVVKKRNNNYQKVKENGNKTDGFDLGVSEKNTKQTSSDRSYNAIVRNKNQISSGKNENNPNAKETKSPTYNKNQVSYDKDPSHNAKTQKYPISGKSREDNTKNDENIADTLPIPVLRHSPKMKPVEETESKLSDAMKKVDDKWKVPVVQKNVLRNVSEDGKNVSILTQLGSIRRQLQLEQLKLDKMLIKD